MNRGREILVLTLAQFLASIETRPSAHAFKISARVESFVVEGASVEHDLVPIITADNVLTGLHPTLHLVVHIVSILVTSALKMHYLDFLITMNIFLITIGKQPDLK